MEGRTYSTSYNMVAYLEKSTEAMGFTEIIDFLNATSLRYALTVKPIISLSFIKQFWLTAKVKIVNSEKQIKAKVDGQNVLIIDSFIRETLLLDDDGGIDTLQNDKIF